MISIMDVRQVMDKIPDILVRDVANLPPVYLKEFDYQLFINKIENIAKIIVNQRQEIGLFFEQIVQQVTRCSETAQMVEQVTNRLTVNISNIESSLSTLSTAIDKLGHNTQTVKSVIDPEGLLTWGKRISLASESELNENRYCDGLLSRNISIYVEARNNADLTNQSCMTIINWSDSSVDEYEDDNDNNPLTLVDNKKRRRKYSPDGDKEGKTHSQMIG